MSGRWFVLLLLLISYWNIITTCRIKYLFLFFNYITNIIYYNVARTHHNFRSNKIQKKKRRELNNILWLIWDHYYVFGYSLLLQQKHNTKHTKYTLLIFYDNIKIIIQNTKHFNGFIYLLLWQHIVRLVDNKEYYSPWIHSKRTH